MINHYLACLGNTKITDLVFADDSVILQVNGVLVMAFSVLHIHAKALGLQLYLAKMKVQMY